MPGLRNPLRIDPLLLATVTTLPDWHPEHNRFTPFPVYGFLIHHPDGAIVVDTGIGFGNDMIDELYRPDSQPLVGLLHANGIDERDVALIVNSHLHFDHCGQNHAVSAKIAVQQAELDAATTPRYTVPEWARVPPERAHLLDGDADVAEGVRALHTPGHTPGHQSVLVESGEQRVIIAAQCIFRSAAWFDGPEPTNLHAPEWADDARASVERLRALRPTSVLLSHDVPPTDCPS